MKSFLAKTFILILTTLLFTPLVKAQEVITIEPLFEYPVAPEELNSLEEKSNYLVKHFWDQLDVKNTQAVNQIALNDAFRVYITPLGWATEKESIQSLDKLINSISGNPTLLMQFTKAAEENLYSPRAEFSWDPIYLKFLDAVIKNKKIDKQRKEKFIKRAELLRANEVGSTAPSFNFTDVTGKDAKYFPMSTPTLLIFGDPNDTDWRLARLRLETNSQLNEIIDKGKLNIIYITLSDKPDWKKDLENYPKKWTVGKSDNIRDIIDIRTIPSIFVVGSDGKIILKNTSLGSALTKITEITG